MRGPVASYLGRVVKGELGPFRQQVTHCFLHSDEEVHIVSSNSRLFHEAKQDLQRLASILNSAQN